MTKIWDLEDYKSKVALVDEFGTKITYGLLNSESHALAEAVERRSLIFCLCRNEIGSVLGYTAFINNSIVPVMVSNHLEENLLDNLIQTYQPEYLWVPGEQRNLFSDCAIEYSAYNYVLLRRVQEKKYPLFDELAVLITTVLSLLGNHIQIFGKTLSLLQNILSLMIPKDQ